ncbi:hypothetical protein AJ79_04897 [Helicocarpus griseus UAMH5409]|uniref:Uncharacterized protein n=1 Tax=Helicocarpus griseus UAMH5409 TaxID=1447875 RepID=A0A2B7XQD3_9EURO|nr:hypothetical protein AJ79_04897 [Helicocarpus griseus UAMH5409]
MPTDQDPQAGKPDTSARQTRSQTQRNAAAAGENAKPSAQDFIAKGPQIPEGNMPPKVPREEIDARMKELNK